jgi:cold shock CspA family protein
MSVRYGGTVTAWFPVKGYGFVRMPQSNCDLFCHTHALPHGVRALEVGQRVTFTLSLDPQGRERCSYVQLLT